MNPRLSLLILAILCGWIVAAKPAKAPSLPPGDIFFTMKGQPFALERTFPGITAAFMFTQEQKTALNDAYHQTVASPQIRAKGSSIKNNPAATDADREAAAKQLDDARAELQKRAEMILTPAQMEAVRQAAVQQREAEEQARKNKLK